MMKFEFREKSNWRTLVNVEKRFARQVNEAVEDAAEALVEDIRGNWSGTSPSQWGTPPAVVSGVLDSSLEIVESDRTSLGRFAKKGSVRVVKIDTSENDPDGESYAPALEDPGYLNRPFVEPAIERVSQVFPAFFKRRVKS